MTRKFDTGNIIECVVDEDELLSLMLRLDINDEGNHVYPDDVITNMVFNVLPEYVFANHEIINNVNAIDKIREAAKALYNTDSFKAINKYYIDNDESYKEKAESHRSYCRGEFGELLLHLLLREFKGTLPLISKVYFKDSRGVPAHGFDAVHYTERDKIIWFGESKLYEDAKGGLKDLVRDLRDHFKFDFLNEQYIIIKKNIESVDFPERDYWVDRFSRNALLKDMINGVCVPLLCVYSEPSYKEALDGMISDLSPVIQKSTRELKAYFDEINDAPLKNELKIILFLFPVKDKHEFVINLHKKLKLLQSL